MSHAEDAEEKGSRVVVKLPELSNVYSTHHDNSFVPQHLEMLLLKQQTQAVNERIPAKGCRLLVKFVERSSINDNGEITETSKSIQWRLMTRH